MAKVLTAPDPKRIKAEFDGPGVRIKAEHSLWSFLLTSLKQYEPAGKGWENITLAGLIAGKLKVADKENAGTLTLEDAEWAFLEPASKLGGFIPEAAWEFIPFITQLKPDKIQTVDLATKK